MPVATRGSIKSVNLEQLSDTKIILGNTYHLYLRPGLDIIKDFGGLHEYINWDQLILTDSGGFQGWSIPNSQTDDGILFKNIYDGTKFLMTPELSIHIQETLNSNIAMILDQLIDINASKDMQKQLNLKVKYRESFRPFAPSILSEDLCEWFDLDKKSPYMLVVADVKKKDFAK